MARVETIVFLSLVLDLFAFTIPLPLFPRLIEWYTLVSDLERPSIHPLTHSLYREKARIQQASCPALYNSLLRYEHYFISLASNLIAGMLCF